MTTCHGCSQPLEPLAAIRVYHGGCDPMGRVEMLEKALHRLLESTEGIGSWPMVPDQRFAEEAARAALAYRPAQMKGRGE